MDLMRSGLKVPSAGNSTHRTAQQQCVDKSADTTLVLDATSSSAVHRKGTKCMDHAVSLLSDITTL
jgi:hypothetical protein